MSEEKSTLRHEARRNLARMDLREEDVERAADLFFKAIQPHSDQIVAAYWPVKREFDVFPILEGLSGRGVTCALPVVQEETLELRFARWDDTAEMEEGPYAIPQPKVLQWVEPDIIIVPMLAFDRKGYRLGQGGGYYDATLAALRVRKEILAVGVAYAQQACLFKLPVEEHDQKLDLIITPQAVHDFRKQD